MPSIFSIANANKPENAPANDAAEKNIDRRVWTSKRQYHLSKASVQLAYRRPLRPDKCGCGELGRVEPGFSEQDLRCKQVRRSRKEAGLGDSQECSGDDEAVVILNNTLQGHDLWV